MSRIRAGGRDLSIPPIYNPRRRRRCAKDPALYLRTYFPHIFWNPFTANQRSIIDGFIERLQYGGRKAEAAPRGEGKTSIARGLATWAETYGHRKFILILAANAGDANANLMNIRLEFERNDTLAEDFPEICIPIRALGGANQRAKAQTVDGARTFMQWTGDFIVLPEVPGSMASGAVIASRGIESAIRGMNYQGLRPDFVLVDDPETRESVRSEEDTRMRESVIDADVIGLAGPGRELAIFYICTIMSTHSLAARYTDRKQKPAWAGTRRKLLETRPLHEDLWEKYISTAIEDMIAGDSYIRRAHRLYLADRQRMDEGSVVSNPFRFGASKLPDGSQLEVSALQFCYNVVAKNNGDWTHFNTEYQNEPPPEEVLDSLALDGLGVMKRCDGLVRGVLPAGTDLLTAAIDLSGRALHWSLVAWSGAAAYVVDYGAIAVRSPVTGNLEDPENVPAVQQAILQALCEFRDMAEGGWPDPHAGGVARQLDLCFIDAGFARSAFDTPVYEFCKSSPGNLYRPSKGFGTGAGQAVYRDPGRARRGVRLFNHAHASWQPSHRAWLYNLDADYWKKFVHDALQASPGRPGSMVLFGNEPAAHKEFAAHLTSESWISEYKPGRGYIWRWHRTRAKNHWFDTTYMACAAAAIRGLKVLAAPAAPPTSSPARPAGPIADRGMSLSEIQNQRRQSR